MSTTGRLRRQIPMLAALTLIAGVFLVARPPSTSASEAAQMAKAYAFTPMSIAMPGGMPQQTVRKVNQAYQHFDAWISSVGAGIAMNDLDGDGLSNDLCITDPRIDRVVVTPAPHSRAGRYAPFVLDPAPLPMADTVAPMGCLPADVNEDGRMDLIVYWWGRTPVAFVARTDVAKLGPDAYEPVEMVPNAGGSTYTGPQWNTNTATVADFDGDGHDDVYIGDYFPDGPVLDPTKSTGVAMNHSMSDALNGGVDHVFRFVGATAGAHPTVRYQQEDDAIPAAASRGWALASSSTDIDGDSLPELYLAHDFGPDRLLYNRSTPGHIRFSIVNGVRTPMVPKSKVLGHDSFKGMGVDFGDLNGDGMYDLFVSNITTSFGIEESHFAFVNRAKDQADLKLQLEQGKAPFKDESAPLGLAWSGWGWDVKMADFDNSGNLVVAQATGFVKGKTNRWPQLQELATSNDQLLEHPTFWPNVTQGDDVGGDQRFAFFAKGKDGRYVNLSEQLGLAIPVPTRGIATGDVDGDGRLDFAVARQWDEPVFYHNDSPSAGAFLGLRLTRDTATAPGLLPAPGSPVTGAEVTVTTPDGHRYLGRVDGGSGHSGKRSSEVHIGLGHDITGPVQVHLQWRDRTGTVRTQDLQLSAGWHDLRLGTQAQEK